MSQTLFLMHPTLPGGVTKSALLCEAPEGLFLTKTVHCYSGVSLIPYVSAYLFVVLNSMTSLFLRHFIDSDDLRKTSTSVNLSPQCKYLKVYLYDLRENGLALLMDR